MVAESRTYRPTPPTPPSLLITGTFYKGGYIGVYIRVVMEKQWKKLEHEMQIGLIGDYIGTYEVGRLSPVCPMFGSPV